LNPKHPYTVYIIDDDLVSNRVTEVRVKALCKTGEIVAFTDPVNGIHALKLRLASPPPAHIILFLDLKMPLMSGWEVLDILVPVLENYTDNRVFIYLTSSSADNADKLRASENKFVSGYLERPLDTAELTKLIADSGFL
jgi:response regulator RpfG family c-di-GMP phosphodiesterase